MGGNESTLDGLSYDQMTFGNEDIFLNNDVLSVIFQYLSISELKRIERVNKRFKAISENEAIWETVIQGSTVFELNRYCLECYIKDTSIKNIIFPKGININTFFYGMKTIPNLTREYVLSHIKDVVDKYFSIFEMKRIIESKKHDDLLVYNPFLFGCVYLFFLGTLIMLSISVCFNYTVFIHQVMMLVLSIISIIITIAYYFYSIYLYSVFYKKREYAQILRKSNFFHTLDVGIKNVELNSSSFQKSTIILLQAIISITLNLESLLFGWCLKRLLCAMNIDVTIIYCLIPSYIFAYFPLFLLILWFLLYNKKKKLEMSDFFFLFPLVCESLGISFFFIVETTLINIFVSLKWKATILFAIVSPAILCFCCFFPTTRCWGCAWMLYGSKRNRAVEDVSSLGYGFVMLMLGFFTIVFTLFYVYGTSQGQFFFAFSILYLVLAGLTIPVPILLFLYLKRRIENWREIGLDF